MTGVQTCALPIYHLKREAFKPGEARWLYIEGNIDHNQFKLLPFQYEHNSGHCQLNILAECSCKIHNFTIQKTLEGIKPEINNAHLLQTANK